MNTHTETENKTEIIISTIEHPERLKKDKIWDYKSWGNGYLEIPKEHPTHDYISSCVDEWGFTESFCNEEITYHRHTETGFKIGFDTLHIYNNESHDKKWVLFKCNQIKDYINSLEFRKKAIGSTYRKIWDYEMKIKELKEYVNKIENLK